MHQEASMFSSAYNLYRSRIRHSDRSLHDGLYQQSSPSYCKDSFCQISLWLAIGHNFRENFIELCSAKSKGNIDIQDVSHAFD
jgi:hypothetical protein